ncbi:tripeptidyl peptidase A [Talaromyces proteolyticus]|uniref:tripeptidyl-peptidase II n=1 Tax=Talaromyces proteolyticus TaxID=1131652 RepID=A0AAD4KD30_9EURO|nr:tripeptidyl peptidase A [Talaromyces proteolyticus]KAH8689154.1 tripeptidyl peptidase A [Talaromyces proteolyticus]
MASNFLLGAALLAQLAAPVLGAAALETHESLPSLPSGWAHAGKADANTPIQLSIALTLQNIDQLENKLKSISTPGGSSYGQYLDAADIESQFGPADSSADVVISWLKEAGIESIHNAGQSINFATTVSKANSLLGANFNYFSDGGVSKLRTLSYSIPGDLKSDIDLISPTTYFGKTSAQRSIKTYKSKRSPSSTTSSGSSSVSVAASCQTSITPSCLKELYNVGNYTPSVKSGSRVGFGSFLNESALYSDLAIYEKFYGIPSQNWTKVIIANATDSQDPSTGGYGESNLDVQNIIGISHPLPVTEFLTGGSPPYIPSLDDVTDTNEPYLPYYEYLLSQSNSELPQVISNSYGDDEQSVPFQYAVRTCNLIGLMGLRGITVLESSGDLGVGSGCLSNDGRNKTQFEPIFPATCPYVLSVGGTVAATPEEAWSASSGGFSNYFPRAWYQEEAVETYLKQHINPATKKYYTKYTNFAGRGFPDISAHSLTPDYEVIYVGKPAPSGGTSAAAPVWAGIIALLNDARLAAGQPALGFLNPFFYDLGYKGLNDITLGQAVGCNGIDGQSGKPVPGGGIIPWATWNATEGWDPVTGLGTPDFQKLKEIVLSL